MRAYGRFERNDTGGYMKKDRELLNEMNSDGWELEPEFKGIPNELLEPKSWRRVEQGVWRHSDAIHNLEARTLP